jgi:hypothetical protein
MSALKAIWNRILSEPAVVTALILAVANLVAADWSSQAAFVESLLVLVGGVIVRSQVSPVRDL